MKKHFDDKATAEQLGEHVRKIGIGEVARRVGLDRAWISLWLSGRRDIGLNNRLAVARECGFRVLVRCELPRKNAPRKKSVEQQDGQGA